MTTTAADTGEVPVTGELTFRRVNGRPARTGFTALADLADAPEHLTATHIRLTSGTELRHVRVAEGDRASGYVRLDNEILTGRRLHEISREAGYPREVSRLYGDEDASADPCALLIPYQGKPLEETRVAEHELEDFAASLLTSLCWLAAAGIAHRNLSPKTVRWLGHQVQITDFTRSAVFGVPREVVGAPPWVGPEQQPAQVSGIVGPRDDIRAAGQLIFFARVGEPAQGLDQIREWELESLLRGVFDRPDQRPTAREMLKRLGRPCPVPEGLESRGPLREGTARFLRARGVKHPEVPVPADLLDRRPETAGTPRQQGLESPGHGPASAAEPEGEHDGPPASGSAPPGDAASRWDSRDAKRRRWPFGGGR